MSLAFEEWGVRTRPWTRAEYHRAAQVGLFGPDERLELLRGEVVQRMPPQKSSHFAGIQACAEVLGDLFGFQVRQQGPLVLGDSSEPEPDVALVRGTWREYAAGHPGPGDVLLLVEVSDTTLKLDREVKSLLYAEHGIQEYWIVNLVNRVLEVHRDPGPGGYGKLSVVPEDGEVAPLGVARSVRVSELLPPHAP